MENDNLPIPRDLPLPRTFSLRRHHDVTGCSGEGIVADGVRFGDGSVAIRWRTEPCSTVVWDNVDDAIRVHGHGGATVAVWHEPARWPEPAMS